jgi:threonine aldolase
MDCTFASDNTSGVHPKVMEALNKANVGAAEPYGDRRSRRLLQGAVRR